MPNRPPPVRTDHTNAFAHYSQSQRVPGTIRETQALNPDYPPAIHAALEHLREQVEADAVMPMIAAPAPDYEAWAAQHAGHANETWLHTQWFFAEVYFYRQLIQAVRWFETGRDPFLPKKREEFASTALWHTLDEALATRSLSPEERLSALIEFDLWGNRIDLSYAIAASHGAKAGEDDLLADDTVRFAEHLLRRPGVVHVICDNCGTELAMDCALADGLIDQGHEVWLHVKMHPTFVSDTVVADVHEFWRLLATRTGEVRALGERLQAAFDTGHLHILPDFYWNSTRFLWDMPDYLHTTFKAAALVFIKGDANYRRAVGDALWDPTTPFSQVVNYFPAPLLALRTLKSDPVVGLPPGLAEHLDTIDTQWRVNGKRGVIQGKL
ncbi:MAG: damage-control phosphatase ARMT1 family protein [Chloroflexota bacterium]|nr:damage-control phosphatase ARMT1 family protein [Chloroflexota bacterium]